LLRLFQADGLSLPAIVDNSGDFGMLDLGDGYTLSLHGLILDQASALLGQVPLIREHSPPVQEAASPLMKITYGTCVALWSIVGSSPVDAGALDCSLAWQLDGIPTYACAGEADLGASALTWLRDRFAMPWADEELSALAQSAQGSEELIFIPALKGLDAPYGIPQARGVVYGMDTSTGLAQLLRAALEAIAFTARDLVESLPPLAELNAQPTIRADGGMAANEYLMQFQADILGMPVCLASDLEATSRGAALLAAHALGLLPEFASRQEAGRIFTPRMPVDERHRRYARWQRAIANTIEYYSKDNP
jgi:glycerol kinase